MYAGGIWKGDTLVADIEASEIYSKRLNAKEVIFPKKMENSFFCKGGRRHKTGAKCAVHKDENCFLYDLTWPQDICVQRSMSGS